MGAPLRWRLPIVVALVWSSAGLVAPGVGHAQGEAGQPRPWYEQVTVNGFSSSSYSFNFGHPDSRTNTLRVFDFDDNTFKIDVFELAIQKPVSEVRQAGFRADLEFGSSIPRVSAAAGLFRDAGGVADDIDLQQAFATYVAPLGSGLRVDVGKFVTHFGYEVIEGYDGWNDNATRSFLFGYAIPFTHTGLRASYTFSPRASGMLMVVNGWDNARDNNRLKSVGGQLALTPAPPVTIVLNAMIGPERTDDNSHQRTMLDLAAPWKASPRLTLGVNGDWGREDDALGSGADASWSGIAGYVRLAATETCALSLRAESFDDADGARTGVSQTVTEFTLTPEVHLGPSLVARGDLRVDHSNRSVFEKRGGSSDSQTTVSLGALYSF